MNETSGVQSKSWSKQKLFLLVVSLSVLSIALVYQPLPENFPQPWKYRVLSFWAHLFSKLVTCIDRFSKCLVCYLSFRVMLVNKSIYSIVFMSYDFFIMLL